MVVPKALKLNSGYEMPTLGLGTWLSKPGEVANAVATAHDVGYRHFDCAMVYGNEPEVGNALAHIFSTGKGKRADVFVTSKIWSTYHSYQKATEAIDISLRDLKIPYLDMCLIHWPMGYLETDGMFPKKDPNKDEITWSDVDYLETWKAMEDAVKSGKVRSIGLSNFNKEQMERILKNCRIKPSNLQVEAHPYLAQHKAIQWCLDHDIVATSYSPLANNTHMFRKDGQPNLLQEPDLINVGRAHSKSPAQAAIRWALQRKSVVIPKSVSKHRIEENFDVWDFELTDDEMKKIDNLNRNWRLADLLRDKDHPHYPFRSDY